MAATIAEKPKFFSLKLSVTTPRVRREDLMIFSRQLAAFVRGGIPILTALDVLQEGMDNATLAKVLADVARSLQLGTPFSDAVAAHPKVFPPLYRSMLESAELTGRLPEVLDQLALYLERDLEAKRKVRAALTYPAVVLAMSVGTVVILAGWVLPKFKKFFLSLGAKLPLSTRVMLASTNWLGNWWFAVLGGAAVLVAGYILAMRTPGGRRVRDTALISLPVVGRLSRTAILERFCRTLGSMVSAGVSLPRALTVTGDATNNVV
jgi:type IV pilus assembly protein PilC